MSLMEQSCEATTDVSCHALSQNHTSRISKMPTGTGVVDAFKNLIRHGKHHRNDNDPLSPSSAQPSPPPTVEPEMQPVARDAAEQIVKEEREAKSQLPVYKGLEGFELVEKMGDGAFSNVYKAIDLKTGKKVAVKVVRKFEMNSSQDGDKHLNPKFKKKPRVTERANILKEVQIMRTTRHPAVVKLISFSESQEHYFLVLELMEGGELFHQIVKLTYFSENLSRHVILQVAQGIRYLHEERGVVHRDIKPENLLFEPIPITPSKVPIHRPYDEEKEDEGEFIPGVGGGGIGRVKIADFGLSKVVWNEETMTPCGTVGYTAPEIVKDERYSKSVDMWALGCVLYTLLCGFPPFYDESINVLTEKVARGYYTFLSPWWDDISSSAKDLIKHLLCVDPAERYTIDEFLAHPWCNASPAPPPPPTPYIYNNPPSSATFSAPLDSPLLSAARGGRVEGRSPGIATLKEAFDITYAVHRMEEEGARRRKYKGTGGAGMRGVLSGLNEDDEEDEDDESEIGSPVAKSPTPSSGRRARKGFELDMDGATLLGRRHRRGGAALTSPLSGKPMGSAIVPPSRPLDPGSPMRIV
ncbi:kinase-like domain-containing protein [Mycena floridula]|nr:kinase-like domain-containing protein [Mycena floridula]